MTAMQITSLLLVPSGVFNAPTARPMVFNADHHQQEIMVDLAGRGQLSAATIAQNLPTAAMLSMSPAARVELPNGFGTMRYRFTMGIQIQEPFGMPRLLFLTGWTDYMDASHSGLVDPNMPFHINNMTTVNQHRQTDALGRQYVVNSLGDNSHVLQDATFNATGGLGAPLFSMRPSDVLGASDLSGLAQYAGGDIVDLRARLSSHVQKANRGNTLPTSWLSDIVRNWTLAMGSEVGGSREDVLSRARFSCADPSSVADPFLYNLKTQVGHLTSTFRLNDLIAIDPTITSRMKVIHLSEVATTLPMANGFQIWDNSDQVTQAAATLSTSVAGLMLYCNINFAGFSAYSTALNGVDFKYTNEPRSMAASTTEALIASAESFKHRFLTEVVPSITFGGRVAIHLEMVVDTLGATHIVLSLDGSPSTPYCFPQFADALSSPIIAPHQQWLMSNANGINDMLNGIGSACFGERDI